MGFLFILGLVRAFAFDDVFFIIIGDDHDDSSIKGFLAEHARAADIQQNSL